jgi:agmatine deiminase
MFVHVNLKAVKRMFATKGVVLPLLFTMGCSCLSKMVAEATVISTGAGAATASVLVPDDTIDVSTLTVTATSGQKYSMPHENDEHEGTWLQWPHSFEYGVKYRNQIESTWIAMTKALYQNENVHIIAYNNDEVKRITTVLTKSGLSTPLPKSITFHVFPTNDVWVRDNGPIFVKNITEGIGLADSKKPIILDWGFNGWGKKFKYDQSNKIPKSIGTAKSIPTIDLNQVVLEGGAIELDGDGTLMATKSCTTSKSRNPTLSQKEIESYYSQYLGVKNFIWLNGKEGTDITDMHIDGLMKFVNSTTIVTTVRKDLQHYLVANADIDKLLNATNRLGKPYKYVYLPLTKKNVKTTYGVNVGYKGTYINYYVANGKVLMPSYNDDNDSVAQQILQKLYPSRVVTQIDCRNLFKNGGMVHCVTQQQPKY